MQHDIAQFLSSFRPLFSRKATFIWFVVIIIGFILRLDHYGVSSFIRWLHLPASDYVLLLHFFSCFLLVIGGYDGGLDGALPGKVFLGFAQWATVGDRGWHQSAQGKPVPAGAYLPT